ncbi:MAG: hypothetical protein NVS3B26_19890 [Mycobacteriales bacterium]
MLIVVAAGAAGLLAPGACLRAGPVLLVVAALLGLPHGAVDHLALGWSQRRRDAQPARTIAVYSLAAAAAAAAAVAVPLPAILVLLVLSAAHFAEGERSFGTGRGWWPAAAAGVAVVVIPLLARPATVTPLLRSLDPGLPAAMAEVRLPVLVVTATLVLVGLASAWRTRDLLALGELSLLTAAALAAPPLVFFAAWFAGWHAPRHVVRLMALEPQGDARERLGRLVVGAALPTLAAVLGLVALYVLLGGLPGAVLVALLALTVPHAAVVARMGRLTVGSPAVPAAHPPGRPVGA